MKIPYILAGKIRWDTFNSVVPLSMIDRDSLVFCDKPNIDMLQLFESVSNVVVLLEINWGLENRKVLDKINSSIFLVENPRLVVSHVLKCIYQSEDMWVEGVHPLASVDRGAVLHPTVSIERYAVIGKCSIGENTRIGAFTIIKDGAVIGKDVTIREFCHIGGCGFGIVKDKKDDRLVRFPHVGRVIIEDNVELFPYVNVDRGSLGTTLVKKGVKIDHYSHIGHNCTVGENTIITARTVMCGGSSIGDNSWSAWELL